MSSPDRSRESAPAEAQAAAERPVGETRPGDEAPPDSPSAGEDICPACGGSGRTDEGPCGNCNGTGRVMSTVGGC